MKQIDPYAIPPSIHQYATTFYGMSMNGMLIAAIALVLFFLIGSAVIGGLLGIIIGIVGGVVMGVMGLLLVTPFASMDGHIPPVYWLSQFRHRHDTVILMPDITQKPTGVGEAIVTDWRGEEIARVS